MMQRFLLAIYGLVLGASYAAVFQFAVPVESSLLPVRGLNIVLLMVVYGWCRGLDPFSSTRQTLIEIALIPFALFGALLAGLVWLVSLAITQVVSLLTKTRELS